MSIGSGESTPFIEFLLQNVIYGISTKNIGYLVKVDTGRSNLKYWFSEDSSKHPILVVCVCGGGWIYPLTNVIK